MDSSAYKCDAMIVNNGLSLSEMLNSSVALVSDKKFLGLQGGGSSLFYKGSEFLILVAQPREHEWNKDYKGSAFMVLLPNGEVDWVGANRLIGGMGYQDEPKSSNVKEQYASETQWYYVTDESQEAETWGLGKSFKQGFVEGTQAPKTVIHVKVEETWKLWGAAPSKAKQNKSAYVWKKDQKAWSGQISFADPEMVKQYFEKYCAIHSDGDTIKTSGLLG